MEVGKYLDFHTADSGGNADYDLRVIASAGALTVDGTISATGGNSTNWNTAYGWGNHASASYATQSYVGTQISNLVDSSPAALNTLNELAAAIGDDASFSTTVTNNIAAKLPLAGGTLTGAMIQGYAAGTAEMFTWRNTTSGGKIQLGLQQNDSDGLHHRAYIKAYKGSATASGNVDLIVRGSGGSITSDVLELHHGQRAAWQGNDIFTDAYHPNADTLTTARTINGVSFNGSANITVADSTKLPLAGGTMTGGLTITATGNAIAISGGAPQIYFNDTSGEDDFYIHINSNRFYVLTDRDESGNYEGPHPLELNASNNIGYAFGSRLFTEDYHPNADTWTTARTITLGGDLTGNVSINGSANVTLTAAVADDSHNHVISNIDGLQTALNGKTSFDHFSHTGESNYVSTTTAALLTEALGKNAFDSKLTAHKTSWSYAGNGDLTDAGRLTELAGTSWLWWTDNSADNTQGNITGLVIAPNSGGSAGKMFVYNNQGASYSPGWREIWTSRSDGAGSGLDADKLDAQEGTYYLDYNNFTNTPTIPQGDITGVTAGTGLTGGGTSGAVTLNVIGGAGITANANDIAVDSTVIRTTGDQSMSGIKTHTSRLALSSGQMLSLGDANHHLIKVTTGYSGATIDGPRLQGHQGGELATNIGSNQYSLRWDNSGNIVVRGDGYFNGSKLEGDSKEMIRYNDSWLRLNPANEFTSGIYCGTGILRTDGTFQVGAGGSKFSVSGANGNVTVAGTLASGAITTPAVYLNNTNTSLTEGSGDALRISTSTGYIDIGSMNSSWIHFQGNKSYYFNQQLHMDANLYPYSTAGNRNLGGTNNIWNHVYAKGYFIDSTEVIDASRNLTNIGTISSGNLTANGSLLGQGFRAGGRGEIHLNSNSTTAVSEMFFGYGDGYNEANIRWGISDRGTTDDRLVIYKGPANGGFTEVAAFDASEQTLTVASGYKIGTTTVIDASRNLTNIADITVAGTAVFNSNIYGKSVNGQYSNLYRFGGIYFTWDSDSYGTNTQHSIRSTDGDTYGDHITLNSFGNVRINFDSNTNGTNYFRIGHATTGTGNVLLTLDESGNGTFAGNVTAYSDIRLKENIVDVDNALNKVCSLRGVYYNMIEDITKSRRLGLVAQEVEKVLPEVVIEAHPEDDKDSVLSVDYGNIVALLIEGIKDQQKEIEYMKSEIKHLQENNNGNN